jgi:hypothetical protein
MKTLLFILLFCFSTDAHASDEWSISDTDRELVFFGLTAVDYFQTIEFTQHRDKYPTIQEANIFMGKHPSRSKVNLYFPLYALWHVGVAKILPKPYREFFQIFYIGVEATLVGNNYSMGVAFRF